MKDIRLGKYLISFSIASDKTFIGYSLYEEDDEPKLYYVEGYDL